MRLYKMFDSNVNYPAFWCSDKSKVIDDWKNYTVNFADEYAIDHEVELRSFNTREIDSQEYEKWNSEDYFPDLSRLEKKFTLRKVDGDWAEWVETNEEVQKNRNDQSRAIY